MTGDRWLEPGEDYVTIREGQVVVEGAELERLRAIERRAQVVSEIAMPMHGTAAMFEVQERTALHILGG